MRRAAVFLVVFAFVGIVAVGSASGEAISFGEFLEFAGSEEAPSLTVDNESVFLEIVPLPIIDGPASSDEVMVFQDDGDVIGYRILEQTLTFGGDDGAQVTVEESDVFFDPVITTAIGVVDFGAASSFAVAVAAPLAPPIALPVVGSLSLSGSFADGAADGGSATPFLTAGIAQATIEGGGVADAGPAVVFATPIDVYAPITVPYSFDCTTLGDGQCDSFDLLVSFTGSGGSDAISFTARHQVDPVPEPATFVLVGLGLLGTACVVRRRRS
jgi:hypothetical protein